MNKCKNNIVWQFGPLKVYGEHFYLIEEIHAVIASLTAFHFDLVKRCQNCRERKDIENVVDLDNLIKDFPMAFAKPTLDAFKNARSTSL
jgi:hypothetical protein